MKDDAKKKLAEEKQKEYDDRMEEKTLKKLATRVKRDVERTVGSEHKRGRVDDGHSGVLIQSGGLWSGALICSQHVWGRIAVLKTIC